MSAVGYTPILIYASGTATNVPLAANMTSTATGAELAINYTDGKLYYKNNSGVVTLLASTSGASGDVVGPASSTDNALARFDLATGKLIQNSVGILSDAGILTGLTGLTSSGSITLSSLTSGRVTYAGTAGLLQDSANLTFNGTTLTANTIGAYTLSGTIAGGGNQINNVIIGTSTPLAGSFTTINASTSITNAGLTSGRVTYAGASGLLSDSSKLTFDTSNLTVGVIGLTANADGATGKLVLRKPNEAVGNNQITRMLDFAPYYPGFDEAVVKASIFSGVDTGTQNGQLGFMVATGGVLYEKIRLLANGNVGIGTSSPVSKLQVYDTSGATALTLGNSVTGDYCFLNALSKPAAADGYTIFDVQAFSSLVSSNVKVGSYGFSKEGSSTDNKAYYALSTHNGTSLGERLRIDSSGNLGLGVTPASWLSTWKALQVSNRTSLAEIAGITFFGNNFYQNTSSQNIYLQTGFATIYSQNAGQHIWSTAPSGSAGAVATITPVMTLDASGNLSVGTTSAFARLTTSTSAGSAGQVNAQIAMTHTSATTAYYISTIRGASTNEPEGLTFKENATERMRIDSSGDVLIGTTSSTTWNGGTTKRILAVANANSGDANSIITLKSNASGVDHGGILEAYAISVTSGSPALGSIGFVRGNTSNTALSSVTTFFTNTAGTVSEKARINSVGNFLVGTTNDLVWNTTNLTGCVIGGNASTGGYSSIQVSRNADACLLLNRIGNDGDVAVFARQGTSVGGISVNTSSTSFNTSSDYRLKEDVQPMTGALATVAQLKPVTYKWKSNGSDGQGFIAHELQAVVPDCVTGEKDGLDKDGKPKYQGVDTSFLVATLVSAIQEQQALIESLTTRLTALENK